MRLAIHSGFPRPTTAPSRASRGTSPCVPPATRTPCTSLACITPGSAAGPCSPEIRSSRATSRVHRADSAPPPERNRLTKAGMSAAGMRAPSAMAAMTSAAARRPTRAEPSSSALPHRGSTGIPTRTRPRSVARPSSVMAPRRSNSASASARAREGNGSGKDSPSPPGAPHTASARHANVRSAVRTSGTVWAGMAPHVASS